MLVMFHLLCLNWMLCFVLYMQDEVVYSTDSGGGVASLLLNRPRALNALNINMIRLMTQGLKVGVFDMHSREA